MINGRLVLIDRHQLHPEPLGEALRGCGLSVDMISECTKNVLMK